MHSDDYLEKFYAENKEDIIEGANYNGDLTCEQAGCQQKTMWCLRIKVQN